MKNLPFLKTTTTKVSQSFTLGLLPASRRSSSGPAKLRKSCWSWISTRLLALMTSLLLSWRWWLLTLLPYKGYMPVPGNCAHVIPCYNKSDKHTPGNYKPISLLCIMSKVMEKLVSKKMWKHLDQHHLISPRQFGFRAGHSTSGALTHVSQWLCQLTQKQKRSTGCLPWLLQSFWSRVAPWSAWDFFFFCTRVFMYSSCPTDRLSQR